MQRFLLETSPPRLRFPPHRIRNPRFARTRETTHGKMNFLNRGNLRTLASIIQRRDY